MAPSRNVIISRRHRFMGRTSVKLEIISPFRLKPVRLLATMRHFTCSRSCNLVQKENLSKFRPPWHGTPLHTYASWCDPFIVSRQFPTEWWTCVALSALCRGVISWKIPGLGAHEEIEYFHAPLNCIPRFEWLTTQDWNGMLPSEIRVVS